MHFTAIASVIFAVAAPTAFGHGWVTDPYPRYAGGKSWNNFAASVIKNDGFPEKKVGYSGKPFEESAVKIFEAHRPEYGSLKQYIMDKQVMEPGADPKCGYTVLDEATRGTLKPFIKYTPFIHPGPCEVYCDNTLVQYDRDCGSKYADGNIPIEFSKCAGANQLSFYFIALHTSPWQVYSYCVLLKGGSGGAALPAPQPGAPQPQPGPAPNTQPQPQPQPGPAPNTQPQPQPQPGPAPYTQPQPQPQPPSPAPKKKCTPKTRFR